MAIQKRQKAIQVVPMDVMFPRKKEKRKLVKAPNGVGGGEVSILCNKATTRTSHGICHSITCSCPCHDEGLEV